MDTFPFYSHMVTSVSKRVRVQSNLSHENEFDLYENESVGATQFRISGYARRLFSLTQAKGKSEKDNLVLSTGSIM